MRTVLFVLVLLSFSAAHAQERVMLWRSNEPTAAVHSPGRATRYCYSVVEKHAGTLLYVPARCPNAAHNHVEIAVPLNAPAVNMRGVTHATRATVRGGVIRLE